MLIRDHKLYLDEQTAVPFKDTPNQGGEITPEYLVMHFTKGASAESSVSWLQNPTAKASAHLVIGRDGGVTQLVDFNHKAWHAGTSQWQGRRGLNGFSIGIELDNYGDLVGSPGQWRTAWGKAVDDNQVAQLPHKFDNKLRAWQVYSEAQLATAREVGALLMSTYQLKDVMGHDDIAPGRKLDPGPAFPMASFRAALLGREQDEHDLYRTTTALNIRTGPGTEHAKLPVSPLPEGTRLEILAEQGVWKQVDVLDTVQGEMDVVGWVHGRYLSRQA